MLFNSLNHLNEIFMFPSLLEQSPRFPEISLSVIFKDNPTGGGSSLLESWDPQGAPGRGVVGVVPQGLKDTSPGLLLGSQKPQVE